MFIVYIIESEKTGKWYYGYSSNPEQRVSEHNIGNTKSTRNRGPWRLIFKRSFKTRSEAVNFEYYLKKLRNKQYIQENFAEFFIGV